MKRRNCRKHSVCSVKECETKSLVQDESMSKEQSACPSHTPKNGKCHDRHNMQTNTDKQMIHDHPGTHTIWSPSSINPLQLTSTSTETPKNSLETMGVKAKHNGASRRLSGAIVVPSSVSSRDHETSKFQCQDPVAFHMVQQL